MLLTRDELLELRGFVAEQLHARKNQEGQLLWRCDHTLTQTRAWLKAQQKPLRANLQAMKARGGYCDCELLLNVSPARWPEDQQQHSETAGDVASPHTSAT